jgi:hypothetical protein
MVAWYAAPAWAHEMSMAELELRELRRGEFAWRWTAGERASPQDELRLRWPDHCRAESLSLHCGEAGLRGVLTVEGVGKRWSAAVVRVYWHGGPQGVYTLTKGQPSVRLFGSARDERGAWEIAGAYLTLGVQHILGGFDHLVFVLVLLFLVGFNARLVWTITAFTVGHSLTLALSALDVLSLRPAPVEALIALSIVLVAAEALRRRQTLARQWPALVAFGFGLLHGLGFAGALKEIGLPHNHLLVALATFNVGVELGQLLAIVVAYAVYRAGTLWPKFGTLRVPALYAIGSVAVYWTMGRVASLLGIDALGQSASLLQQMP